MAEKSMNISIYEVVGSPLCVSSGDGQKVYERLAPVIEQGRGAVLSFRNVALLTSAFLNTAIGQLYGKFDEEQIRASLNVADMEPDDAELLKRVVETAKRYFKDPEGHDQRIRDVLEDGDDDS